MTVTIERIGATRDLIGESPWWDVATQMLTWVDSERGLVRTIGWDDGPAGEAVTHDRGGSIGSLARRRGGGMAIAGADGFVLTDAAGATETFLGDPEAAEPRTRFNDGKTDRSGAFLAGTMLHDPAGPAIGGLYRLGPDGLIKKLERAWRSSNGPCFSPDGRTFYFADSLAKAIFAYDYATDRPLENKRAFFDAGALGAIPDGATVDADGCVWSVLVTAAKIVRMTPEGRVDRTIDMPVPLPASVMFGGRDLDTLFVTSIALTYGDRVPENPLSGGLFAVRGLGAQGVPETRFAG